MNGSLNTIRLGDCVAGMNSLPAGSVDLVFADPPFNIGYDYDVYDDRKEAEHYLDWSQEWISAVNRVLKPTGTFWLAIGDEYAAELKVHSQKIGFHCRSWVIWYYTFGVNCLKKFTRSHAHLFHFVKDAKQFTFRGDDPANRIPSARQLVYNDTRANPKGRQPDDTWILRPQDAPGSFTAEEDTWYFPRVAGTFKEREGFHGCQMPEQLLGRIIRLCSNPGELVVDPFSGSATTLAVAKKLGRSFLGFDLSEEYVERGQRRLSQIRLGDALDGSPEPTVSAPATPSGALSAIHQGRKSKGTAVSKSAGGHQVQQTIDAETVSALVRAFEATSDGYSLDRVVADPILNETLIAECQLLGIPGEPRAWNRWLMVLRKNGKLAHVRTTKRTSFLPDVLDHFLFASEIALQQVLDGGVESLDAVLCDPAIASQFDQVASRLAPGHTPLQYRWGALKLRKEAKDAHTQARRFRTVLKHEKGRFGKPLSFLSGEFSDVSDSAGLYLLKSSTDGPELYVGESLHLRTRLKQKFQHEQQRTQWLKWANDSGEILVQTLPVDGMRKLLAAYQAELVRTHKTPLNYSYKEWSVA